MFRASSAHIQEHTVVHMQHMVLSLSIKITQLYGLIKHAMTTHLFPE